MNVSKPKSLYLFQIVIGMFFSLISVGWFETLVQADERPVPTFEEETTTDSMNLKVKIHQVLSLQNQEKNLEPLTFTVDLGTYTEKLTEQNVQFKLIDHQTGIDLSDLISFPTVNQGTDQHSTLQFHLSSEQLNSILKKDGQVEQLDLELTVPLNVTDEKLMTVYNAATQQFDLPVSVENSVGKTEAVAKVAAPIPTGTPVSQAASVGTTTEQLDATDCVTDLHSALGFDKVKVVGFKEKVSFDTVGNQNVTVLVESEKTGKQAEIPVPITVSEDAEPVPTASSASGVPFKDYDKTTIVDSNGNYVGGKEMPDTSNAIFLNFTGKSFVENVYKHYRGNSPDTYYRIWNQTSDTSDYWVNYKEFLLDNTSKYDSVLIDKVGIYKGKAVKLRMEIDERVGGKATVRHLPPDPSIGIPANILIKRPEGNYNPVVTTFTFLDSNDQPIYGADIVIPILRINAKANVDFRLIFNNANSIENYIVSDTSKLLKNNKDTITNVDNREKIFFDINDFKSTSGVTVFIKTKSDKQSTFSFFFDNWRQGFSIYKNPAYYLVPFKINLPAPNIDGITNKETMNLQADIEQYVPKQSASSFYDDLDFTVNLNKYVDKNKINANSITLSDKITGESFDALTNDNIQVKDLSDGSTGLTIHLPASQLKNMIEQTKQSITLNFKLDIPLDTNDEKLLNVYNKDTQQFSFPVSVNNGTNSSESTAYVVMQKPTGSAIFKTSSMGLSTDDLNPADYIKELHSVLGFDKVKIIGFKEKVVFDTTGIKKTIVLIESEKTGVQGEVAVPIRIINDPLMLISVPKTIELEDEGKEAVGNGEISYQGKGTTRIKVDVPNPVELKCNDDVVTLDVYNEKEKYVKTGDLLTELSSETNKTKFSLKTKKQAFQKRGKYKGTMTFRFVKENS